MSNYSPASEARKINDRSEGKGEQAYLMYLIHCSEVKPSTLDKALLLGYLSYYLEPEREAPKFLRAFELYQTDKVL